MFGAMEGTRTPGLLIRSQSLYPAELPTHTFRSEHDVFYHEGRGLSTAFLKYFYIFQKRTSFLLILLRLFCNSSATSARKAASAAVFCPPGGGHDRYSCTKNWFFLCSLSMRKGGRSYCTLCTYARAGIRFFIKTGVTLRLSPPAPADGRSLHRWGVAARPP